MAFALRSAAPQSLRIFLLAALIIARGAWAQAPQVEVKTSMGSFVVELYPDKAPKTVANFIEYANSHFYDGTIFHRVIDGFMIQGGGFDGTMRQKATRAPVENEAERAIKGGLKNDFGTIAMARTPNPHSATAQFFINVKNNDFLNFRDRTPQGFGYTVFGRVVKGMDVVLRISKTRTATRGGFQDVPVGTVTIESVTITKPGK